MAVHLVPLKSGILSTMVLKLNGDVSLHNVIDLYQSHYAEEPFIRLRGEELPQTGFVEGTNFCDIGFARPEGTDLLIVASAICNLGKGASGQAVQNMNVMMGIEETTGLL